MPAPKSPRKYKLYIERLSLSHKGQHNSPETEFKKDFSPWNKGKSFDEETRLKISTSLKGRHNSIRTEFNKDTPKEFHPRWKGGVTLLQLQIRHCKKYALWRSKVFRRDNWTCQTCRLRGNLEAHHSPNSFQDILERNEIISLEQAVKCKEFWDINNGVTLCKDCHKLTRRK